MSRSNMVDDREAAERVPKVANVLFDEAHSESWSICRSRAQEVNSENPANSSYALAADALESREFTTQRNVTAAIDAILLRHVDILVFLHPCDRRWEHTTLDTSPIISAQEINDIYRHVEDGGSLLIVTEYENDKYGNNLNDLLRHFDILVNNTTVEDRTFNANGTPTWVMVDTSRNNDKSGILHQVETACFYRAGACQTTGSAQIAVTCGPTALPRGAGVIALSEFGRGRVAVVTDSDIFGDEYIKSYDNEQLWLNLLYWLAVPAFKKHESLTTSGSSLKVLKAPEWTITLETVNKLRLLQGPKGNISTEPTAQIEASSYVTTLIGTLGQLVSTFPYQRDYFAALAADLEQWQAQGFGRPDFTCSLAAFNPQDHREDGLHHVALFPLYTPNASMDVQFEVLVLRVIWPGWLSGVFRNHYHENHKFVPAEVVSCSDGYMTECAVLFPETVSISGRDANRFGIILCGREALRFRNTTQAVLDILQVNPPPDLNAFLCSLPLVTDTFALWDLIHDTSHSRGELPFDPFMVRQRAPYWMYALEELRVDLRSYLDAVKLARELPFAEYVRYAVLFDRIFRFAITGNRVRNYDALAGQLLFNVLHSRSVLRWEDNKLSIDWMTIDEAVAIFYDELRSVYRSGQVISKVKYWSNAHDFICKYMAPNVASDWARPARRFADENRPQELIDRVHTDEFPLGSFHLSLRRKLEVHRAQKAEVYKDSRL